MAPAIISNCVLPGHQCCGAKAEKRELKYSPRGGRPCRMARGSTETARVRTGCRPVERSSLSRGPATPVIRSVVELPMSRLTITVAGSQVKARCCIYTTLLWSIVRSGVLSGNRGCLAVFSLEFAHKRHQRLNVLLRYRVV